MNALNNTNNTMKQSVFVVSAYGEVNGNVGGFVAKVTNTEEEAIAYMKNAIENKYQEWLKEEQDAVKETVFPSEIEVHKHFNHLSATVSDNSYGVQNFLTYTVGEQIVEVPIVENAEQHVLKTLKVSNFVEFLQDMSKRFEVSIKELLPSDYDLRHIDNVDYIERKLIGVVMDKLFESLKKRKFLTEYIAYTTMNIDNADIYFLGKRVYDLSSLIEAETYLNRHSDSDPNFREKVSEQFRLLVGVNAPIVKDNFIGFKLRRLTDEINGNVIDQEFVKGNLTYYVSVDMLKGMSRQEFDDFVKTYFDNERIDIVYVNSNQFKTLKKTQNIHNCETFDQVFKVIHQEQKERKSHKEKRVYVFNINCSDEGFEGDVNDLSDDEFIRFAEEDGRIYSSIENFINAFNLNEVSTDCDYARVIEVDCYDDDEE